MRSNRQRSLMLCSAVAGSYVGSLAFASPISFGGGTYSQNFSSLPIQVATFAAAQSGSFATGTATSSSGTGTFSFATLSTPFDFDASNTSGGLGISQLAGFFGGASTSSQFGAQNGGTTKGGVIDFGMNAGVSTAGQRFIGLLDTSTTSPDAYFGLGLVNNTGSTINSFNLGFVAALWRQSNVGKTLYFGYETGAPGTAEPAPTSLAGIGSVTFATAGSAAVAVDGTVAANQKTINDLVSIPGGVAAGSDLYLEWYFSDSTGSAQGIGISTLSFSVASSGTGSGSKTDTWTVGAGSGAWDIGNTSNFTASGSATTYTEGDAVVFPDFGSGGSGTINITAASVSPSSIAVSNNTGTYTIIGNPIIGTAALTKTGNGTLVLSPSTTNGYSGGTNINGGTIMIAADAALGASAGAVSLNGGALVITAPLTSSRSLSLGANGGTVAIGSNSVTYGAASGSGAFNQLGTGTLTFTGSFAAVTLSVTGGTLAFDGGVTSADKATATVNPGSGGGLNGNILLASNALFTVTGNTAASPTATGSLSGSGSILVSASGATITNTGSEQSTIGNNIVLNQSPAAAFAKGDVTQSPFVPANFVTVIGGATKPNGGFVFGLTLNGTISGNSDVVISNDPLTGGGSGALVLNQSNTYLGTTVINMTAGQIVAGVDNALPTTTDIIIGGSGNGSGVGATGVDGLVNSSNTGTIGACSMDLAGHSQSISSISDGDEYGPSNVSATSSFKIINSGTSTSTLTVSGSTTPFNGFSAGLIGSGTASFNNINLVKGGSNTLTLNNSETYSGSTTVNGGTLSVSSTSAETAPTPVHGSIASTSVVIQGTDASGASATLVLFNSTALSSGAATTLSVVQGVNGATVALDFSGIQTLGSLLSNGSALPNGFYSGSGINNSTQEPFLTGTGEFDVVPEPASTLMILSVGVPALLRRRRRHQSAVN